MRKNKLLYSFIVFIVLFLLIDILEPINKFSEFENRKLKNSINFNINKVFSARFKENYEKYINDQVAFRDFFISLKSYSESAILKVENNGIIYGSDGYLFEKYNYIDRNRQDNNIKAINEFIRNTKANVSVIIAPNSYGIYNEKLPLESPVINMEEELKKIYSKVNGSNNINIFDTMIKNKKDYIYYKTDHHFTTYGAYLTYKDFIHSINKIAVNNSQLEAKYVHNFLGTYFSKSKKINIDEDTICYYEIPNIEMTINDKKYNTLYDYNKFNERDKYSGFIYGNNPLTVIKNKEIKNREKILIIKDSYANSMIPFLTQNFEEVHVIDLRSYSNSVLEYINYNKINEVLILYNFINFNRDANIIKIKK